MVIVIAGTGPQIGHPAPAYRLYDSEYFKASWFYAKSVLPEKKIFVLSAKYGLIRANSIAINYSMNLSDNNATDADEVMEDAKFYGIEKEPVMGFGPPEYISILKSVWEIVCFPLEGKLDKDAVKILCASRGKWI